MNAEIISIGTELLLGEITDTNSTYIARQLRDIGVNLFYITAIGDNQERITRALRQGLERSDLILTTGGLGPTVDDMTRQCVAAATGHELVFHQQLLDEIARRFEKFGVNMTENNRQQAHIPADAIIIENPVGTAPCYIVESEQGIVISLPGVPREMKYLMEHSVLPYLRERVGLPAIIKARVLRTAGIGESSLDDRIKDLMTLTNPTVGLAAHSGQTDIRITARADTEAEADIMIADLETQVRQRVGQYIYGADKEPLDEALANRLNDMDIQLAVCEAGTNQRLVESMDSLQVVKAAEYYEDIPAMKAALNLNGSSISELAREALAATCMVHDAEVGLCVLHEDGNAGLAIKTTGREYHRELHLGNEEEAARWAYRWGLGYIWRYLSEAG